MDGREVSLRQLGHGELTETAFPIARRRINVVILYVSKNQLRGKNSVIIREGRCRVANPAPHYLGS